MKICDIARMAAVMFLASVSPITQSSPYLLQVVHPSPETVLVKLFDYSGVGLDYLTGDIRWDPSAVTPRGPSESDFLHAGDLFAGLGFDATGLPVGADRFHFEASSLNPVPDTEANGHGRGTLIEFLFDVVAGAVAPNKGFSVLGFVAGNSFDPTQPDPSDVSDVPVPATLGLLASALCCLSVGRRRAAPASA